MSLLPQHTSNPQPVPRPLVIVNVLNYGHFNVHADTCIRWATGRGLPVALVGRSAATFPGRRAMIDSGHLTVTDIEELCPGVDWDDAETARIALGRGCRALVAAIARRYRPLAVLLINADEVFFNDPAVVTPDYRFAAPVWGIVTFGRRQAHFGLEDPYTWRLDRVVAQRQGFTGLLSIDEYHVTEADPDQRFLHYLPDPYRDFSPSPGTGEGLAALRAFWAGSEAPVVPILGKFDHRKGNLWTLQAVAAHPTARVVILGQRQPDPEDDAAIDAVLARLSAAGRAFVRFGFVSQDLFEAVLASGRVPCLPLPYRNHAGSSGLQLLGFEHGIASLVPDFGLMAERVRAHGLGVTFRLGDAADFTAKLGAMLEGAQTAAPADMARFMTRFGAAPTAAALDGILADGDVRPLLARTLSRNQPASPWLERAEAARAALGRRDLSAAKVALDAALAMRPGDATLTLLRLAVQTRLGNQAQAVADCKACLRAGLVEEVQFFLGMVLAAWPAEEEREAAPAENYDAILAWLVPCFPRGILPRELVPRLLDAAWRLLDRARLPSGVCLVKGLLRFFPGDPRLLFVLVHARLRQQRFDAAEAALTAVPEGLLRLPPYRLAWAYVRQGQGRLEEAGDLLDGLLADFPDHPEYRRSRGAVWAKRGDYASAVACFARLAEEGDATAYLNWSDCLRYAGRFDEAVDVLKRGYALGACPRETLEEKLARIETARAGAGKMEGGNSPSRP